MFPRTSRIYAVLSAISFLLYLVGAIDTGGPDSGPFDDGDYSSAR